ncbi:type 1 fimbrin D-mannose specific adhesin FimH, partial [Escherichia coli]|nr:type 1 fimbrin D-mannose specific adhesin FimH [Escherichia coli]
MHTSWLIKEIINKIICRLLLAMACLCLANISWATVCA